MGGKDLAIGGKQRWANNAMHLSIGAFVIMVAPLAGDRER